VVLKDVLLDDDNASKALHLGHCPTTIFHYISLVIHASFIYYWNKFLCNIGVYFYILLEHISIRYLLASFYALLEHFDINSWNNYLYTST